MPPTITTSERSSLLLRTRRFFVPFTVRPDHCATDPRRTSSPILPDCPVAAASLSVRTRDASVMRLSSGQRPAEWPGPKAVMTVRLGGLGAIIRSSTNITVEADSCHVRQHASLVIDTLFEMQCLFKAAITGTWMGKKSLSGSDIGLSRGFKLLVITTDKGEYDQRSRSAPQSRFRPISAYGMCCPAPSIAARPVCRPVNAAARTKQRCRSAFALVSWSGRNGAVHIATVPSDRRA